MLFSVDTKVRGRFSEKRCGPSRRCARNASAALENFVCCPQKTFSTASVKTGKAQCEQMFSAVHPTTDIAKILRHVRFVPTFGLMHRSKSVDEPASQSDKLIQIPPEFALF